HNGQAVAFLAKVNASGNALDYSTYLGGSGGDAATAIAVDGSGNAYLTGYTYSTNFPTVNPLQAKKDTLAPTNAFVAEVNAGGSGVVYSTYLGGGRAAGNGIAVDSSGNAYVTGDGGSGAWVTKVHAGGTALDYATTLSNTDGGAAIAVDGAGNA